MSSTLKNYIQQLQFISKIKNKKIREGILQEFSNDQRFFNALKEIVENTLRKNIPLKPKEKRSLRKYKKILLQFTKPKISKRKKKQLVVQSGGYLNILIPVITSFLTSLLNK
ncbi:MAG: hypothetical protein QM535_21935 [Limnohabitans sp.]|nr:hypothetical protein [Limnohabitans sp.]